MKLSLFRSLALAFAAVAGVAVSAAADLPILAKARARLGSDATLEGIKSLHYTGTMTHADPRDATKTVTAKVDLVLQKPDQQRITAVYDEVIETTVLDGTEGWTRNVNRADPTKFVLRTLNATQVKTLRANTWESLAYFRGLEKIRGRIEDKGPAMIDGVACEKVAFVHPTDIVFLRYFDLATGRLVYTETDNGSTYRESGDMVVDGIHFPRQLVTTTKNGDANNVVTLIYEKVTVNEVFPHAMFAFPSAKNN